MKTVAVRHGESMADLKFAIGKKKLLQLLELQKPSELADRISAQDVQVLGRPVDDPVELVPSDRN